MLNQKSCLTTIIVVYNNIIELLTQCKQSGLTKSILQIASTPSTVVWQQLVLVYCGIPTRIAVGILTAAWQGNDSNKNRLKHFSLNYNRQLEHNLRIKVVKANAGRRRRTHIYHRKLTILKWSRLHSYSMYIHL